MNTNYPMTLNQLAHLCAIARTGSYTRAAEESNVDEPVLHRTIRRLEKACSMKLVEKAGGRIRLTKGGQALHEYATQITSLADLAKQRIEQEKGLLSGRISVGTGSAVAMYVLPEILSAWMVEHPNVEVTTTIYRPEEIYQALLEDRVDVLIVAASKPIAGLRRQLLFADELVVVTSSESPLANVSYLSVAALSKERLILQSSMRAEIDEVGSEYGVQFKVVMEVSQAIQSKQYCLAGIGVGFLSKSVVMDEIADGRLHPLDVEGFPRTRSYFLVSRVDKTPTPEIRALVAAISEWGRQKGRGPHPLGAR